MGLEAQCPQVCFYYINYFLRIDFVYEHHATRASTVNVNTNIRMHVGPGHCPLFFGPCRGLGFSRLVAFVMLLPVRIYTIKYIYLTMLFYYSFLLC
jgi:hypothetical protein